VASFFGQTSLGLIAAL
jgi:hypothetical protein